MGLIDHLLALAPRLAWALAGVFVLSVLTVLLSLGAPRRKDGWLILRPTPLLYLAAVLSLVASPMLAYFGATGLAAPATVDSPHPRLVAALEVLVALVFPYCAVPTFGSGVRFNEAGVAKRWLGRWRFHPWSDIARLKRSFFAGPVLVMAAGGHFTVSEYWVGFADLARMAQASGVEVEEEFLSE